MKVFYSPSGRAELRASPKLDDACDRMYESAVGAYFQAVVDEEQGHQVQDLDARFNALCDAIIVIRVPARWVKYLTSGETTETDTHLGRDAWREMDDHWIKTGAII